MTYCVGLMLDAGMVLLSDTRTNAGLDNISTFEKMKVWEEPGSRVITLLSSGNLATTQAVVSLLDERMKTPEERDPSLLSAPSMFQAARLVAETLNEVIGRHAAAGQQADRRGARTTRPPAHTGRTVRPRFATWPVRATYTILFPTIR